MADAATLLRFPRVAGDECDTLPLILRNVRGFCAGLDDRAIDEQQGIDRAILHRAGELGLCGLTVPTEYGGFGLSITAYARVIQEVASASLALAVTLGAHQAIGCRGIVLRGTPDQKSRYLPRCATGEWLAALGLTEPNAGSALMAMTTSAVERDDGRWQLNGSKTYITNGGIADVFTIVAAARPKERARGRALLSAFVVERAMGVKSGPSMAKLGIRGSSTTELFFDDVLLPAAAVLGPLGSGLPFTKEILCYGRITLCAGAVAASKRLLRLAVQHARNRLIGSTAIADFWMVKERIARVAVLTYAQESILYVTTGCMDRSPDHFAITAMAKVFCSEAVCRVADEAVQIAGGAGYMRDYPYERIYRDVRITPIFEGTNEVLRVLISSNEMRGAAFRRRELAEMLGAGGPPVEALAPATAELGRLITELDAALEQQHAKHGHRLSTLQPVQRRLADAHIQIYALLCVLSRAAAAHAKDPSRWEAGHGVYARAFCEQAAAAVRSCLKELTGDDTSLVDAVADGAYAIGGELSDAGLDA